MSCASLLFYLNFRAKNDMNPLLIIGTPQDDKPASLRRDKNDVIDNHDMLNVTPEYKAHVASKLSGILQK